MAKVAIFVLTVLLMSEIITARRHRPRHDDHHHQQGGGEASSPSNESPASPVSTPVPETSPPSVAALVKRDSVVMAGHKNETATKAKTLARKRREEDNERPHHDGGRIHLQHGLNASASLRHRRSPNPPFEMTLEHHPEFNQSMEVEHNDTEFHHQQHGEHRQERSPHHHPEFNQSMEVEHNGTEFHHQQHGEHRQERSPHHHREHNGTSSEEQAEGRRKKRNLLEVDLQNLQNAVQEVVNEVNETLQSLPINVKF